MQSFMKIKDGNKISNREKQVISMMAEGHTAQEVATKLGLSIHTIRTYIKSINNKLGARNITHAVSIVMKGSLTPKFQ